MEDGTQLEASVPIHQSRDNGRVGLGSAIWNVGQNDPARNGVDGQ